MTKEEKRAEEYAWKVWPNPMFASEWEDCKRDYIQGAEEQKAIDDELLKRVHKGVLDKAIKEKKELIDKACEWISEYLMELGCPDDWCRDSAVQDSGEQRFRKAMED